MRLGLACILLLAGSCAAAPYVVLDALRSGVIRAVVAVDEQHYDPDAPGALVPELGREARTAGEVGSSALSVDAGPLRAEVGSDGLLVFSRTDEGTSPVPILSETSRSFTSDGEAVVSLTLPDRVYGFGEHENGRLDSRGLTFDMETCLEYRHSYGGEVCLPFILGVSNATNAPDYGLLWNMPNFGSVSFGASADGGEQPGRKGALHKAASLAPRVEGASASQMTWVAYSATQYELVVAAPSQPPKTRPVGAANDILDGYTFATGRSPHIPERWSEYVHSRNRYSSQDMLVETLDGFVSRDIPLSIIVIDYFNWPLMGDWRLDPQYWPTPKNMTSIIEGHNVSILVSAWPFSVQTSDTYDYMASAGLGTANLSASSPSTMPVNWPDGVCVSGAPSGSKCMLYDATQDGARSFFFSRLAEGYVSQGIHHFWLDAAEPEQMYGFPEGTSWALGPPNKTGMIFPLFHTQSVYDGLRGYGFGDGEICTLARSGWAGVQRHASSVWSGDTHSNFETLQHSVVAGLNGQMSGIAWWTLDIGGYNGGDPTNAVFNRLIVRWFEFGLTLPIFRQHGHRETEPWVLKNASSYAAVVNLIRQRYQLAFYVRNNLNATSESGRPLMRPLWWDFPADPATAGITEAYMFGDGFLARPVVQDGVSSVNVYLPRGDSWINCVSGASVEGGTTVTVPAPLGTLVLFKRGSTATQTDMLLQQGMADRRAFNSTPVCKTSTL